MYIVQDNAASDFANSTPIDQAGAIQPTDPMNCVNLVGGGIIGAGVDTTLGDLAGFGTGD